MIQRRTQLRQGSGKALSNRSLLMINSGLRLSLFLFSKSLSRLVSRPTLHFMEGSLMRRLNSQQ
jgi:hypothetical protein